MSSETPQVKEEVVEAAKSGQELHQEGTSPSTVPRGHKRRYSDEQSQILEDFYEKKKTVNEQERKTLAGATSLSGQQISRWFENRRYKEKKARGGSVEQASTPPSTPLPDIGGFLERLLPVAGFQNTAELPTTVQSDKPSPSVGLLPQGLDIASTDNPLLQHLNQAFFIQMLLTLQQQAQRVQQVAPPTPAAGTEARRGKYTREQLRVLLEAFNNNQHPTSDERKQLADQLKMTRKQVSKWFQNRRHLSRVEAAGAANGQQQQPAPEEPNEGPTAPEEPNKEQPAPEEPNKEQPAAPEEPNKEQPSAPEEPAPVVEEQNVQ
uniref:Homeobox domain-containing protein n=1 Tax=Steinernema glaseri TaxID=37863 RepID=A0A1I7ZYT4_9BILA